VPRVESKLRWGHNTSTTTGSNLNTPTTDPSKVHPPLFFKIYQNVYPPSGFMFEDVISGGLVKQKSLLGIVAGAEDRLVMDKYD
jgi:hypothetical protein